MVRNNINLIYMCRNSDKAASYDVGLNATNRPRPASYFRVEKPCHMRENEMLDGHIYQPFIRKVQGIRLQMNYKT